MTPLEELDERETSRHLWLLSLCGGAAVLGGKLFFGSLELWTNSRYPATWLRLSHIVLVVCVLVWLTAHRDRLTVRACTVAGVIVLAPTPLIHWYSEDVALAAGSAWNPFIGDWITLILVATLFPGTPRVLLLVVSVLTLVPLLHRPLWIARGASARVDIAITLFHWFIAAAIIALRAELGRVHEQYRRTRSALFALHQLILASRALRDGANTPLQALELLVALQRRNLLQLSFATEQVAANMAKLRTIIAAMPFEGAGDWSENDQGFRAERRLAMLQEALLRDVAGVADHPDRARARQWWRRGPSQRRVPRNPSPGAARAPTS